jgi:cell division protein FtsI/penicillin-binding protein 2
VFDNNVSRDNGAKSGRSVQHSSGKRIYPYGELAGQVLGYIGKDGNGLGGIEYTFDKYLTGENGWGIVKRYGRNHRYARIGLPKKIPKNGCNVYLTLDIRIQSIVEKVLGAVVNKFSAKGGLCIVMDPVSGDILAMANEPRFNPNIWKVYSKEHRRNRCVSDIYEPGSTFKVVTAAIVLQENLKSEKDIIDGNHGVYKIYDQVIHDHKPYGELTFSEALSYSSNVCFSKVAAEIKNKCFYNYTKNFGLGAHSGICLTGEEIGIVHQVKKWSGRTRVTMAIGQEISTTLLQMVVVFSTIANGGVLMGPHIYQKITDSDGRIVDKRAVNIKRRVIDEDIARRLRRMMTGVVEYGTAKRCALPGLSIGGKTGTSQKVDKEEGGYSDDKVWASFIGFIPVENPALVCGIVVNEPVNGGVGGIVAAPAFRQIIQQIISHPELEYAAKLITDGVSDSSNEEKSDTLERYIKRIPDVCRIERKKAAKFLSTEKIPFEIIGIGNRIAFQSPPAGSVLTKNIKMILYTKEVDGTTGQREFGFTQIRVPNCVGKDLRDAVNALNIKGLVPYVKGAGIVKTQQPIFGAMVQKAVTCTLVCSFEG